jgi:peptide/nickel transport system permease protein
MFIFLLKRIALFIPSLLLVVVIAFFLSKSTPSDTVETILQMQGVTQDNTRAHQEYARIYQMLHLNKPEFYFSIVPDFYPNNVSQIIDQDSRYLAKSLMKQQIPYTSISHYLNTRKSFLVAVAQDTVLSNARTELIHKVQFESNLGQLVLLSENSDTSDTLDKGLAKAISQMYQSRMSFYYPTFRWHGVDNQFHYWIKDILKGDFGISSKDGRPVLPKVFTAMTWTLLLTIISLTLAILISVPIGLWSGMNAGSFFDKLNRAIWLVLYAIPVFWLASMLIIYFTSDRFGRWMYLFPAPGLWYVPPGQSVVSAFFNFSHQLILPVLVLVANDIAPLSTLIRNNVIEQKSKPYFLMAVAKGLSMKQILYKHIFPNVMLPFITVTGGRFAAAMSGALIVEVIFNIPGMGRLMYDSIYGADWNVVFAILIVIACIAIAVLTISDMLYVWADPRIRNKTQ